MKIIDAHWDNENLGYKTYEFILDSDDKLEDFRKKEGQLISSSENMYLVVKVPTNNPMYLQELPKMNYQFVEASFKLTLKKRDYNCPSYIARFDKDCTLKVLKEETEFQRVYDEILKGIFKTDRIAIDQDFSEEVANKRYVNWIKALVAQGEKIYEVNVKNEPIGFFVLKHLDDKNVQGILTGLYKEFEKSGYGALVMKKLKDTVWDLGYKTYHAQVVSNNVKALRSNLIFGSMVESIGYHYIKKVRNK